MSKLSNSNKGFTLLEMCIALSIAGLFLAVMYKTPLIVLNDVQESNRWVRDNNFEIKMFEYIREELKESSEVAYIKNNELIINNAVFKNKEDRFIYIKEGVVSPIFTKPANFKINKDILKVTIGNSEKSYEIYYSSMMKKGGE